MRLPMKCVDKRWQGFSGHPEKLQWASRRAARFFSRLDIARVVTGRLPLTFPVAISTPLLFSISSYLLNSRKTSFPVSLLPSKPFCPRFLSRSLSLLLWFMFPDPRHVLLWQSLLKLCAEDSTTLARVPSDLQDAWPCPSPHLSGVSAASRCFGIIKEHEQRSFPVSPFRLLRAYLRPARCGKKDCRT